MSITEHKTSFAGYPLLQWNEGPLTPSIKGYRLAVDFDDGEPWTEKFASFVHTSGTEQVEALVVGAWWNEDFQAETDRVVESLVQHHERLPNLKALFIADVTFEESEISWINQSDLSPVFLAYPRLEHFGTRGAQNLQFGRIQHEHLRSFVLESGGTSTAIIDQLASAQMPQLTDFELWTGHSSYGWNGTLNTLLPFIRGETFPRLTRLGICNCEITDEVVQALVESPLYERLQHLDLSDGTFGDEGADVLLKHPHTRQLTSLDVSHHFCFPETVKKLEALAESGVNVTIDEPQRHSLWGDRSIRYVAVGE